MKNTKKFNMHYIFLHEQDNLNDYLTTSLCKNE